MNPRVSRGPVPLRAGLARRLVRGILRAIHVLLLATAGAFSTPRPRALPHHDASAEVVERE